MVSIINRSMVLGSAAVAAVLVGAFVTSGPRAANPPVIDQVAQRFPLASEMFTPVPVTSYVAPKFIAAQKASAAQPARPTRRQFCAATPGGWPYVSEECRVAAAGTGVPTFMRS